MPLPGQFDPLNPVQSTVAGGGLGQASPPGSAPPQSGLQATMPPNYAGTQPPWGNTGTMLSPDAILQLMGTLNDPEARRHKFIGALLQGTHSGSSGESIGNAYSALGDYELEQKRLVAAYAPLMLREMTAYNSMQHQQWTTQQEWMGKWNGMMTDTLSSLGTGATTEQMKDALLSLMQQGNIPPQVIMSRVARINTMKSTSSDEEIAKELAREGMPAKERAIGMYGEGENVQAGGVTVPTTKGAIPALASGPGPGVIPHMPADTGVEIGSDAQGGFWIKDKLTGRAAAMNSQEGREIAARHPAEVVSYIQRFQQASGMQIPGFHPPGAGQPPPPGPGPGPQPPGPQAAPAPGMPPPPVAGGPGPGMVPPGARPPPPPMPGGAAPAQAAPPSAPPPGVHPGAPVPFTGGPGGATISGPSGTQYTGLPVAQSITAGAAAPGGMNPVQKTKIESDWKTFGDDTSALSNQLNAMNEVQRRADAIRQLIMGAPQITGAGATARADVGRWVREVARYVPGISDQEAKTWENSIAGGDIGSLQTFQKLAISGGMAELMSDMDRKGQPRQGEFMIFRNAVANPTLEPQTMAQLQQISLMARHAVGAQLDARNAVAHAGVGTVDPSAFNGWWQNYLSHRPDLLPPGVVNTYGVNGSTKYTFFTGPNNEMFAVTPGIRYTEGAKKGQMRPFPVNSQILQDNYGTGPR